MRPRRFAVLLAVLTASLAGVALIESHWDEDSCIAIGWLVSKGWRLYSDIFTHHTPLDYLPASLIADVFGPSLMVMRAFMIALWAAVAAALYAVLRRREVGARTGVFFALLSSQWLTYWYGQMMLIENYWSYAVVLALALLGSPLGLEPGPSPRRAAALGALIAFVLTASPVCLPVSVLLALWAVADARWRGLGRWMAAGAAGWLVFFGAWASAHADLGLLWQNAVVFNREVYARFYGLKGGAVLSFWRRALDHNAAYFASAFEFGNLERYFESLAKLIAMSWVAWSWAERRWAQAVWKLAFLVVVHSRPEKFPDAPPFHAAPFYMTTTLIAAAALARIWDALSGRRRTAFALAAAALLLPTLWATSLATASLRPFARSDDAYDTMLAAVRSCTAPQDRVVWMPCNPRFYLDTDRLPATPSVFYLPWQEAWEPQRRATMDALARHRPKVVLIQDTTIWGVPWHVFGSGVDSWLKAERYAPVLQSTDPAARLRFQLFVRPDAAPAFVACARNATL
jgi:hypothetical protein